MRTLIVGAGVAGLTLAALLRQRGERPVIIERAADFAHSGYNIALYPLGSRVLHGLGLHQRFLDVSVPGRYYRLGNSHGHIAHHFDFGPLAERYGPIQGLRRSELLEVLAAGLGGVPIRFGTTATRFEDRGATVRVAFNDGSSSDFDLVVGADGMHSETRKAILSEREYAYWESGWGCWVAWTPADLLPAETMAEYWGAGALVGLYPVKDALGVVLAGPKTALQKDGRSGFAAQARKQFGTVGGPVPAVLDAVEQTSNPFFWDLHDCRAHQWAKGRIVLLGDAAAGFLPTAGVGASMAMLSASALADELSRTDAAHVEYALRLYVRRNKQRVEAAQDNSRKLGRLMFVESLPLAWGRDQLMRFYTLDQALKQIVEVMEGSI
ncbi:MAG: FAD-dependent monooxygenase [Nitrospira sp.]|nr:FAD-dependent monooxygenase [Nitrospira sp.]